MPETLKFVVKNRPMPTDTPPSTSAIIPPAERASIAMVFCAPKHGRLARVVDCAPLLLAASIAPASRDDGARSARRSLRRWRQMAASLDDNFWPTGR